MGFAGLERLETSVQKGPSLDFLHRYECNACPLNRQADLHSPKMLPTGEKHPLIYIIGEAPGETEDRKGVQFVGKSGRFLRDYIPDKWLPDIRWNNVIRCRPPDNREPTFTEIECCRPSIVRDIEQCQPLAVFGFGNVPLSWILKETGITKWNGRKIPVKIGNHSCWFFPMLHPSAVLRSKNGEDRTPDYSFSFELNLEQAFAAVDCIEEPIVHTKEHALANIECYTGKKASEVDTILDFIESLYHEEVVGFDYETKGLRPYGKSAKILTIAASGKERTVAFALHHKESQFTADERAELVSAWEKFLYNAPCLKVAHNLAFEMEWSALEFGLDTIRTDRYGDSISQAYLLDGRTGTHSLEFLCIQYFGINIKELSKVDRNNLDSEPLSSVLPYNGVDSKYHRNLFIEQRYALEKAGLEDVYNHHIQRIPTVVLTQIKGVPINQKVVAQFEDKYNDEIKRLESEMFALDAVKRFKAATGHEFNPGSNSDVPTLLKQILKINLEKGADEEALSKIDHPFADILLRWRKANKLLSTYVTSVKEGAANFYPDGLIHPVINTTRVRTWRTSSDGPNIQNWPKHGEGKEVRKQVDPDDPDLRVVSVDFAGIQARNVAMESKDHKLVQAFWERYDIHTDWMERLVRIYPKWIDEGLKAFDADKKLRKAYRQRAKNEFVFASFFGAQPKTLARGLQVPESTAGKLLDQFWGEFPEIKNWHDSLRQFYQDHGYVTGLSGFRRYAPVSPNELINTPIQSDESIIVCNAWNRIAKLGAFDLQPMIMLHDDLTWIWHKDDIDKNLETIIPEMLARDFEWINVPLEVEVSVGKNWADMEEVSKFMSTKEGYKEIT